MRRLARWAVLWVTACGGNASTASNGIADSTEASDAAVEAAGDAAVDDESDADTPPVTACRAALDGDALALACAGATLRLTPFVLTEAGEAAGEACTTAGEALTCRSAAGALDVREDAGGWRVRFTPSADGTLRRVGLRGTLAVSGARGWLSNGFQSWSMSGALALRAAPAAQAREDALATIGDVETLRGGAELSWWYTVVGGGPVAVVAGATRADTWKSWAAVDGADPAALTLTLASGADEAVPVVSGAPVDGAPWFVGADVDEPALLRAYAANVPSRRQAPLAAEVGWNSWYDLWDTVDADAVLANAARARQAFADAGVTAPLRIVVDDGWQQGWGDWEPNAKFPDGLDGLVATLHADGFEAGVWLAPLLVAQDDPLVIDHPDWFVGGTKYPHAKNGPMRVLDVTHPEAAAHLQGVIQRLVGWGLDFLKIDFLFAGTWEGTRHEAMPGMAAYARALTLIREAAGPTTRLLAVGAPPIAGFDQVDGWRLGPDIALEPFDASWFFVAPQARNLAARWMFCRAVACDADPPILRSLAPSEVVAGAWVAALAGGAYFLSDDLRELEGDRLALAFTPALLGPAQAGEAAWPASVFPEPALPAVLPSAIEDTLAATGTVQVPRFWTTPDGTWVGLNTSDTPVDVGGISVPARSALPLPKSLPARP